MTKDELIEAIGSMTVLELSELVKALEEKFGVSAAAAPMAMAMPAMAGAPAAEAAEEEEKTEFDVVITGVGDQKIQVIKVVRQLTSLGLREAKAVVDEAPSEVIKGALKEDAEAAKAKLEEVGATVELR